MAKNHSDPFKFEVFDEPSDYGFGGGKGYTGFKDHLNLHDEQFYSDSSSSQEQRRTPSTFTDGPMLRRQPNDPDYSAMTMRRELGLADYNNP